MTAKGTNRHENSTCRYPEVRENMNIEKIANSSIRLEKLGRQRSSGEDVDVHELDHRRSCMLCGKYRHTERFEARQQLTEFRQLATPL